MRFFSRLKQKQGEVTFATSCWEGDYRVLLQKGYLEEQIARHSFPFSQKILVINNVENLAEVQERAFLLLEQKIVTDVVVANKTEKQVFSFFSLEKESFCLGKDKAKYPHLTDSWVYFNALAPLTAIYVCTTPFLLYQTADVSLGKPTKWIEAATSLLQKKECFKVANLTWNKNFSEAKREAYSSKKKFYLARQGFSDQMFLVKTKDFQQPIYNEIREDASHYPRGEVFEKRVFSYMKNHGWLRLTYTKGYYLHDAPGQ